LVALSAANTLHQDLSVEAESLTRTQTNDLVYAFAEAAGRFADACEKIDHLEEFVPMAKAANRDIVSLIQDAAAESGLDLDKLVRERRQQLRARAFYIQD
jgi:aminopeptidase N